MRSRMSWRMIRSAAGQRTGDDGMLRRLQFDQDTNSSISRISSAKQERYLAAVMPRPACATALRCGCRFISVPCLPPRRFSVRASGVFFAGVAVYANVLAGGFGFARCCRATTVFELRPALSRRSCSARRGTRLVVAAGRGARGLRAAFAGQQCRCQLHRRHRQPECPLRLRRLRRYREHDHGRAGRQRHWHGKWHCF